MAASVLVITAGCSSSTKPSRSPTTTSITGSTSSRRHTFCARTPLRGRIGYDTRSGQFFGTVMGLPADHYLLTRWLDATVTPPRRVAETSSRTDRHGAARFTGTPSFISPSAHVTQVIFNVGASDRDAHPYGLPAYPC